MAPEHHELLLVLRRDPGVVRWWQEPRDDFLAAETDVHKYAVLVDRDVIGFVQWHEETDPMYRHAGVDLFIGDDFQGRGLGSETVRVLCAHLIDDHGFHRLVIDDEKINVSPASNEISGWSSLAIRASAARGSPWLPVSNTITRFRGSA